MFCLGYTVLQAQANSTFVLCATDKTLVMLDNKSVLKALQGAYCAERN